MCLVVSAHATSHRLLALIGSAAHVGWSLAKAQPHQGGPGQSTTGAIGLAVNGCAQPPPETAHGRETKFIRYLIITTSSSCSTGGKISL